MDLAELQPARYSEQLQWSLPRPTVWVLDYAVVGFSMAHTGRQALVFLTYQYGESVRVKYSAGRQ